MYNQTHASLFLSFCSNIIDLWKGFSYNDLSAFTVVNNRNITVSYLVKDISNYNSLKPYVDKYYNYLSLIEAQPGDADAHAKEFTWDSSNHTLKYVNDDNSTQNVECSNAAFTHAIFRTDSKNHKHNGVNFQDQCDLCGYRQGMANSLSYIDFLSCNDVFSQFYPSLNGRTKVDVEWHYRLTFCHSIIKEWQSIG